MKQLDYVRETFKKKSFIIKERTPQKRKGDSCIGRVLHDNKRAFPHEFPGALVRARKREPRARVAKSQSQEPDRVYRAVQVSKISSHSVICFKLVQNLQNETKLPLIDLSLTKMTEEF